MAEGSILDDVKQALGQFPEQTDFDRDIVMHINSVLSILHEMGVGPVDGFAINDASAVWPQLLGDNPNLNLVKSYIFMKVSMIFDPPQNGVLVEARKSLIEESEWRIKNIADRELMALTVQVWVLETVNGVLEPFPEEARIGDLGYDPETGKLWRME